MNDIEDYSSYDASTAIPSSAVTGPSNAEIDAMRRVLESLNKAGTSAITETLQLAHEQPEINDILNTSFTGKVRIGNIFEIRIREIDSLKGTKKVYDIYNSATGETITNDLFLYEAAFAIVKYLNAGRHVLGSEIRNVIKLEQDYAAARTDAGMFKVRLTENVKRGNRQRVELFEARFQEARDRALRIKADLKKIAESLT
jgi:hypothetical protein